MRFDDKQRICKGSNKITLEVECIVYFGVLGDVNYEEILWANKLVVNRISSRYLTRSPVTTYLRGRLDMAEPSNLRS